MNARMRHVAARPHLHDALIKGDPTGTFDIRKRYRGQLDQRWRAFTVQLRMVVIGQDMLGLKPNRAPTALSLAMTSLPQDGVLRSFQTWVDNALLRLVLGNDSSYLDPMIVAAYRKGLQRAQGLSKNNVVLIGMPNTIAALQQLMHMELQGILEAVSQRIVRHASDAMLNGISPANLMALLVLAVNQVGVTRGRSMIESMVVKAHATATLDQFEAAGIQRVGLLPERIPVVRKRIGDAVTPAPQRGTRRSTPSKTTVGRIRREEQRVESLFTEELVEIETAGDDLVCEDCESLAADGPYTIDQARGVIPAHPNCRCAFVPESEVFI